MATLSGVTSKNWFDSSERQKGIRLSARQKRSDTVTRKLKFNGMMLHLRVHVKGADSLLLFLFIFLRLTSKRLLHNLQCLYNVSYKNKNIILI